MPNVLHFVFSILYFDYGLITLFVKNYNNFFHKFDKLLNITWTIYIP